MNKTFNWTPVRSETCRLINPPYEVCVSRLDEWCCWTCVQAEAYSCGSATSPLSHKASISLDTDAELCRPPPAVSQGHTHHFCCFSLLGLQMIINDQACPVQQRSTGLQYWFGWVACVVNILPTIRTAQRRTMKMFTMWWIKISNVK